MDPISYGVAAKQKQRIEKVIAEPDSTSGVITVPQVIATGETITVPAGRTAVLPNVQVDGELVVDGEVFIPSGAGLSTVVQKSGDTMTGNLNFASGTKITGDFNNAVNANRTAFQSTNTGSTQINVIPNNTTAGAAMHWYYGSSDIANTSRLRVGITSTNEAWINSEVIGTGVYAPIVMATGGSERVRINTAGNVGIGTTSPNSPLVVGAPNTQVPAVNAQFNGLTPTLVSGIGHLSIGSTDAAAADKGGVLAFTGNTTTFNGYPLASIAGKYQTVGAGVYGGYLQFSTTNSAGIPTERMRIDANGNVGVGSVVPDAASRFYVHTATGSHGYMHILNTGNFNSGTRFTNSVGDWYSYVRTGTGDLEFYRNTGSGNMLITSPAAFGYGKGSGGTVTQATSKSTAVTLNKPCGQITMNNAALAAGATVLFTFYNSTITAGDTLVIIPTGLGQSYDVKSYWAAAGIAGIQVTNKTAGTLSEALVLNFAVLKGATA